MGQTSSTEHLHQLIHYADAELRPTGKQQGGVVNDHMTLDLVAAAPVNGVIGGLVGPYTGAMAADEVNSVIDSHMNKEQKGFRR